MSTNDEELAARLKHEGIRAGEIIAYRAWRVIVPGLFRSGGRLHSVHMRDYVWHPDEPASGDVRTHGIYSFREVTRSEEQYGYHASMEGPLVFGKIKIWGGAAPDLCTAQQARDRGNAAEGRGDTELARELRDAADYVEQRNALLGPN